MVATSCTREKRRNYTTLRATRAVLDARAMRGALAVFDARVMRGARVECASVFVH